MGFLMPKAPAPPAAPPPPPAPPTMASPAIQDTAAAARTAAAAAAGGFGFNGTVQSGPQGAPTTPTAKKELFGA